MGDVNVTSRILKTREVWLVEDMRTVQEDAQTLSVGWEGLRRTPGPQLTETGDQQQQRTSVCVCVIGRPHSHTRNSRFSSAQPEVLVLLLWFESCANAWIPPTPQVGILHWVLRISAAHRHTPTRPCTQSDLLGKLYTLSIALYFLLYSILQPLQSAHIELFNQATLRNTKISQ